MEDIFSRTDLDKKAILVSARIDDYLTMEVLSKRLKFYADTVQTLTRLRTWVTGLDNQHYEKWCDAYSGGPSIPEIVAYRDLVTRHELLFSVDKMNMTFARGMNGIMRSIDRLFREVHQGDSKEQLIEQTVEAIDVACRAATAAYAELKEDVSPEVLKSAYIPVDYRSA